MIVAVVGDNVPGVCACVPTAYPDTGIIITGINNYLTGGSPVSQVQTSIVLFSCGTAFIVGQNQMLSAGMAVGEVGYTATGGGCPSGVVTAKSTISSL